ncbi:MAG TPA: CoA pyrophosphatase [Smithellaceae bacterium]|nr:CoA pyrophosphatase [Smithellaceae bacterium]
MDLSALNEPDTLPALISDKLSGTAIDYREKYQIITASKKTAIRHHAAGVLLLLSYGKTTAGGAPEFFFQLIKRSQSVSQAGDISCPGGMLHHLADGILSRLLTAVWDKEMFRQNGDEETGSLIRLFLTNALRESWEEIGLKPWNVRFLGALPCYSLLLFSRTIFPLVAVTKKPFRFSLSSEVESVVEIPLRLFFEEANYANLEIDAPQNSGKEVYRKNFPCLVVQDAAGSKIILWGATFFIITNFLSLIFGDSLPETSSARTIKKSLNIDYLFGKHK